MEQQRITRSVIHIITRHSNMPVGRANESFKNYGIYPDKLAWAKVIDLGLISLGAMFCVAGITFFFAYNWHELHKFIKLGLIGSLIVAAIFVILYTQLQLVIKNIILTGASMLVGVLFAVFGQIYQTGADAYDFFLGWTVFMAIWALVSNFTVLWLFLLILINITIVLYVKQVGPYWSTTIICMVLFLLNGAIITALQALSAYKRINLPRWFVKIVTLGAVVCSTIGLVWGIMDGYPQGWGISALVTLGAYSGGLYFALHKHSIYHLCIIPLSCIIIIVSLFAKAMGRNDSVVYFLSGIIIIISVTTLVSILIKLNKRWHELD